MNKSKPKEKMERQVIIMMQPSLYKRFESACEQNYKNTSDMIRELIFDFVKKEEGKNE